MREYELVLILHPELDETAFNDMVKRISTWITDGGGEIVKTEVWGKRPMAYPIRKQTQGQYVILHTRMAPTFGATIERNLRIQEQVLRYMLSSKE